MTEKEMIALAEAEGFAAAAVVDTDKIVFDPMFRPFCEENLCGQYGVNYSCPPDCGTPEEMKQRVVAHKRGLVLQTIWEISDYTDKKAIKHAKGSHNAAAIRLMKQLRAQGKDGFLVGASGCALCSPCALKNGQPCTYPDLRYSCMSAYCVDAQEMAHAVGMICWGTDDKIRYFSQILFHARKDLF